MKKKTYSIGIAVLLISILIVIIVSVVYSKRKLGGDFWKRSIIYQIYPRSLKDGDRDGIGDLSGITQKVDYIASLGVGAVWLSPFFKSPMKDFGYDISDFYAIDPIFGTMKDFKKMITELKNHGLRVILDFVPNHTSDQHEWFIKSENREMPYTDYYVWADSKGNDELGRPIPPNNWVSGFKGSAWEWSEKRKQFYYHQFLASQPDLNFRNDHVKEEMEKILTFWMDKGVDGFRMDAVKHLVESEDVTLDEPIAPGDHDPTSYEYLEHIYTSSQPENLQILREWRVILDGYIDKVLIAEMYSDKLDEVMTYYGSEEVPLADFPFNFFLISNFKKREDLTGETLNATVSSWLENLPDGKWPNWVLGSHDVIRVGSRVGSDLIDALNMLALLLPGTPITYYGEEIGMESPFISWEDTRDPNGCRWGPDLYQNHSRDPARTPMQWDDTHMAGFTSAKTTWLPVNPNYTKVNVEIQDAASTSHLKVYKKIAHLRKEDTFWMGKTRFPVVTKDIFSFRRTLKREGDYLVVINTSKQDVTVNLHTNATAKLPPKGTVEIRSITDNTTTTEPGSVVSLDQLSLVGGEGIVLNLTQEEEKV